MPTITLIPGDGIGPSITEAVVRIIEATGARLEWDRQLAGIAALEAATIVHLGAREMLLRIAEGNGASLAVAERAGYVPAGREPASCNGMDALVFRKRLVPPAT